MTIGLANGMRRMVAGLVILCVIVLSFGQAFAVSPAGAAGFHQTRHAGHRADVTPSGAGHDHSGSPHAHHGDAGGGACCLAGGCPMLLFWLPAAPSTPPLSRLTALVYRPGASVMPAGAINAPDVPPPRHRI